MVRKFFQDIITTISEKYSINPIVSLEQNHKCKMNLLSKRDIIARSSRQLTRKMEVSNPILVRYKELGGEELHFLIAGTKLQVTGYCLKYPRGISPVRIQHSPKRGICLNEESRTVPVCIKFLKRQKRGPKRRNCYLSL